MKGLLLFGLAIVGAVVVAEHVVAWAKRQQAAASAAPLSLP